MLLYVDNALYCSYRTEEICRNEFGKYFVLKEESVYFPEIYAGNKVKRAKLENGVTVWSLATL